MAAADVPGAGLSSGPWVLDAMSSSLDVAASNLVMRAVNLCLRVSSMASMMFGGLIHARIPLDEGCEVVHSSLGHVRELGKGVVSREVAGVTRTMF